MIPARRSHAGQGLTEFALVIPVVLLVVIGFVEVGRAVYAYNTIANAARQGARVAAVNQILATAECDESRPVEDPLDAYWSITSCAAAAASTLGIEADAVSVTYEAPPDTALGCAEEDLHIGCLASVTVTYHFELTTPLLDGVIGPIEMRATSHMPIERVFP